MIDLINNLQNQIKNSDCINKKISSRSVGWQIDHSLKVIIGSSTAYLNSNPKDYKPKFNLIRFVLFTLNFIPRGKGKAPKSVMYDGDISQEYLINNIEIAKTSIKKVMSTSNNNYFNHYLFGHLTKKNYLKFVKLHTKHHLKIINDIIN